MRPINFALLTLSFLLTACSTTVPVDEEVVANSPTHPKVSQRPVYKENKKDEKSSLMMCKHSCQLGIWQNCRVKNGKFFTVYFDF